jgi:chorismate dehydratase
LKNYWHYSPTLLPAQPGFEEKIGGTTGAVVIGDRAISLHDKFAFIYDLGEAWMHYTGLPFVFAAWVSNRPLPEAFIQRFNEALRKGVELISELMFILPTPHPGFDLQRYFTENISYKLDAPKRKALKIFLNALTKQERPAFEAIGL